MKQFSIKNEKIIYSKIKKVLPDVRVNVLLKNYTSFKIGGPARYFFTAKTKQDLIKAVKATKELSLPFFILGGGSNLLVSDKGYDGLVIKCQMSKSKLFQIKSKFQNPKIYTESGVLLNQLVVMALENGLTGLESVAGIPGTVGGAIKGNAGAFGMSMADIVKSVEVLEIKQEENGSPPKLAETRSPKIKIFKNKDCKFGYRDSIFKHNENLIILSAEIELSKGNKKETWKKTKGYLAYRKNNQPLEFPCAGSIFKNPKKFSAGELIEKSGLKGKKIGKVQISEKHANFIVNLGAGKAKDVLGLIKLAKEKVKEKFGIELEEEVVFL